MDHRQIIHDSSETAEVSHIEDVLKAFWDKARAASELIARLREEKHILTEKQAGLESQVQKLLSEINIKDQEIKRLKAEHSELMNLAGEETFSVQEKDALKERVRELIAKINSHL